MIPDNIIASLLALVCLFEPLYAYSLSGGDIKRKRPIWTTLDLIVVGSIALAFSVPVMVFLVAVRQLCMQVGTNLLYNKPTLMIHDNGGYDYLLKSLGCEVVAFLSLTAAILFGVVVYT
jgi:hypothetical protein